MLFPFQLEFAQVTEEMGRIGCRVIGPEPVEQRQQMRPVQIAVALGGILGLLDRDEDRLRGCGNLGKGACMQLIGKPVAQRVIFERHQRGSVMVTQCQISLVALV